MYLTPFVEEDTSCAMGFPLCYFCDAGVAYTGLTIASSPGLRSP
jgi:hypothetical protein